MVDESNVNHTTYGLWFQEKPLVALGCLDEKSGMIDGILQRKEAVSAFGFPFRREPPQALDDISLAAIRYPWTNCRGRVLR